MTLTGTCHYLMTGRVLQTEWISAPPPIMFFCGNTAQSEKSFDVIILNKDVIVENKSNIFIWILNDRRSIVTCVLLWYCSVRSGMTADVMMWLALLEALHAACSSLALGHTSLRSGSLRWCLQSGTTLHLLGKPYKQTNKLICLNTPLPLPWNRQCFKLFIEHSGMSYLSEVLPENK